MKKILIAVVIVLVIAVVALFFFAKAILANALEKSIGAPVQIGHFRASLSEVGIFNLKVGNPPGFREKTLAEIPEIYLSYDFGSFLKRRPHIKEIRLNVDQVTVERNGMNVNLLQLGAVQNLMERSGKKTEPVQRQKTNAEKKSEKPMHVQMDQVLLTVGRARYVDSTSGVATVREFPINLKDDRLKNVNDPKQITMQIVSQVLSRVGLNALAPDLNQFGAGLGVQVEQAKKTFEGIVSQVRSSFEQKPTAQSSSTQTTASSNSTLAESLEAKRTRA